MNEFTQVLKDFRRGDQSLDELFTVIEQSINEQGIQASDILDRLADENTRAPFAQQTLAAIRQHIASSSNSQRINTQDMDDTLSDADTVIEDDELPVPARLDDQQQLPPAPDHPIDPTITDYPRPNNTRDSSINLVGTTLNDRYELESLVGSGGMGTVYRAIDQERLKSGFSNPYVAIKILHRRLSLRQGWYSNFQQEASRCQQLAHPNIVEVYGFNSDGPNVYLSMEYLEGETLKQKIRHHSTEGLPYRDATRIITAMGEALVHAHDHGIVHYDFKPNNVFVTRDGRVKVIDFGIARTNENEPQSDHSATNRKALTPNYASPQMLEHQVPDPRDDIFAYAITCYETLTGRHPFARKLATKARDAGLCPTAPEKLNRQQWEILDQSLAFDRDHRTATIYDFLQGFNIHKHPSQRSSAVVKWIAASIVLLLAVTALFLVGGLKLPFQDTASTIDSLPVHATIVQNVDFASIQEKPAQPRESVNSLDHQNTPTSTQETPSNTSQENESPALSTAPAIAATPVKHPEPPSQALLLRGARNGDLNTVNRCLSAEIPANSRDRNTGQNALILAAIGGHKEVIASLLKERAAIDRQDHEGKTALAWATIHGQTESVELLLEHGADGALVDRHGETALMHAAWNRHVTIINALLNHTTEVNTRNSDGMTPLMAVTINGQAAVAAALLNAGADPNLTTHDGRSPLMAAAWNGHPKVVRLLCERGSLLDTMSNDGWTALMNAAWNGHQEIVKELLMAGANPYVTGWNQTTAAQTARTQGYTEIAELLVNTDRI
ncbi:MAG: protein kinase [Gammaproteobacteria bacterium]|nr:protein kinase [Gammaproteobacteria bacterium]